MAIKVISKTMIFLILILASFHSFAAFFDEKAQGWHWYQDPEQEFKEEKPSAQPQNHPTVPVSSHTEALKAYQKELERRLHKAWVDPSFKNVLAYQEMQKDLMQRSQNFSESWMQVVYSNPHLDHTLVSPVNQKARHIYLDQEKKQVAEKITELKDQYGLFFFFSSQCDYCHQFAPIVKQFSKNYGWEVVAISVDGGVIPGFSETFQDNGLVAQWKIEMLPALFAIDPKSGDVLPVAYGLSSLDQMETRIMTLIKTKH